MNPPEVLPANPPSPGFAPVRLTEVELSEPLPLVPAGKGDQGVPYRSTRCLVRLHGQPLGFVSAEIPSSGLQPGALAELIQRQLGEEIERHLDADGVAPAPALSESGIPDAGIPPCRAEVEEFLTRAPSLSVVVPTRNRPDSVAETVAGLLASSYPRDRFEIVVVDNASGSDATVDAETFARNGGAPIRVVSETSPGGSNARNRGLSEAGGEIVVFADDDVVVDRDWLTTMARAFDRDERVGGVAGLTAPSELETPPQAWFEGRGGFMRGLQRREFDLADPPPDRPLFPFTVGDYGSGQNMAFRRDLLLRLGGFSPALGTATPALAGEDLEAMLRVLLAGYRVVYDPAAIVLHAHPRTYEQFEKRAWGYGVGLTACLTKAVVEHPRLLLTLARKLPLGLMYAISPGSEKNENRQSDYPPRLARLELRGMAYGPLAYARSRLKTRSRPGHGDTPTLPLEAPARLRVLIVTDSYAPLIGGANRSAQLLARHLADLGHSIAIATAWQPGVRAVEDEGRVRIHRIRDLPSRMRWISEDRYKHNPPPFPDPEAVLRLRRLIREFRPDIVHAYGWLAHSAAAALTGSKIPLLISARDYGNVCAVRTLIRKGKHCQGPAPRKCLSCSASAYGSAKGAVAAASVLGARPLLRRRATAIHSVSRYVAAVMDRYLAVEGGLTAVIPNFHEDSTGKPVDEGILARLPNRPFILYVGAFRRIKGIDELLAAYGSLDDPPPLVMVGTRTPDSPRTFPAGVTVIENVPYPTVIAIWDQALFGVLPSKAPEALGNVVHEAMSRGRAMIATGPGGPEDMIESGESGLIVPGGDTGALAGAMKLLIEDAPLRERLGALARERAHRFTPEVVMPEYERLYYETIERFRESQR